MGAKLSQEKLLLLKFLLVYVCMYVTYVSVVYAYFKN